MYSNKTPLVFVRMATPAETTEQMEKSWNGTRGAGVRYLAIHYKFHRFFVFLNL